MQTVTTREIVVARYKENIDWLTKISPIWKITVYNKGPADIPSSILLRQNIRVIPLENKGREAETFAYHLLNRYDSCADFTLFLQASPFDHAPELFECINTLELRTTFSEAEKFIPVTIRYNINFPPAHITYNRQNRFFRMEEFSVYTLDFVDHADTIGAPWILTDWLKQYNKPSGTNIMKYFFDSLEWEDALKPNQTNINFSYAACFGVTKNAIQQHNKPFYQRLYYNTFDKPIAPYIAERAWLHIFNKEFNPDHVLPESKGMSTPPSIGNYELVVARYKEDISWLVNISPSWKITVYNKGPDDIAQSIREKENIRIIPLENKGREAGTYAYHMKERYNSFADVTIFIQANPFDHNPEIFNCIEALERRKITEKYIPLTIRYSDTIPPSHIVESRQNRFYRVGYMSPYTLDCIEFIDAPIQVCTNDWLKLNKKASGTNIMKQTFDELKCKHTVTTPVIKFHFAACFAVTKESLLQHSHDFYERLFAYSVKDITTPYILERAWLHMFDPDFSYDNVLPEWSITPAEITEKEEDAISKTEVDARETAGKQRQTPPLDKLIEFSLVQNYKTLEKVNEQTAAISGMMSILQSFMQNTQQPSKKKK